MNYTPVILCLLGLAGVLLHNLVKLDTINRRAKGKVNFAQYIALEKFTILISLIIVVIGAFFLQHEMTQLEAVAKYLGFGFLTLGYFAQSVLVKLMGGASKYIDRTGGQ